MKPQSPCYKCEERYYKCHTYCSKYLNFQKDLEKFNQQRIEANREYSQIVGYEAEKRKRLNRYKK